MFYKTQIVRPQILFIALLAGLCLGATGHCQQLEPREAEELIRAELIYPIDCLYSLPARFDTSKEKFNWKLASTLAKEGIIGVRKDGSEAILDTATMDYELVRKVMDLHYKLLSVNLRIGLRDIRVTSVLPDPNGRGNVATGEIILTNQTRIYDIARQHGLLSELHGCVNQNASWHIAPSGAVTETIQGH